MLTICPRPPLAHVRQQPQDQANRAEVVELHRAFVVMEAVIAERHRASDRAARVVDEHVDVAMVAEHTLHESIDLVHVGDVGRIDVSDAARCDDLRAHLLELLDVARDEQRNAAGRGDLDRRRLADARGAARDQDGLAAIASSTSGRADVWVELALPVVPQPHDVLLELWRRA